MNRIETMYELNLMGLANKNLHSLLVLAAGKVAIESCFIEAFSLISMYVSP